MPPAPTGAWDSLCLQRGAARPSGEGQPGLWKPREDVPGLHTKGWETLVLTSPATPMETPDGVESYNSDSFTNTVSERLIS